MRFEVRNIIRSVAQGYLRKALKLSQEYLTHLQNEKNNEFKVMKVIQEILKGDSQEEENIKLNRNGVAKLIGVSINVIINWERNGLIEVPRNKNGYRVYGGNEIKLLRIIKILRQENYRTQCICRMVEKLKPKSKEAEDSKDLILSFMSEAESGAKELISYIEGLIGKDQNI